MKKTNLFFAMLLWAFGAFAQTSMTLTNCAKLWKNGAGITGATLGLGIETPGFPTPYILIPMDSTQSCVTTNFGPMNISPDSKVTLGGDKDDTPLNGLNVIDLLLIRRHILGLEPFTSPYALLAADVNRSGSITAFDLVEISKVLLGVYTEWPSAPSAWRFVPEYTQFPNPANPFQGAGPNYLTGTEFLAYDNDTLSLVGLKLGDVDGDANPLNSPYQPPTGIDSLFVILPDIDLNPGNAETTISVSISEPPQTIHGAQFRFRFKVPGIQVVKIIESNVVSSQTVGIFSDGLSVIVQGSVETVPLFSFVVKFNSLEPVALRDAIEIWPDQMIPIAVSQNAGTGNTIYRLKQKFDSTSSIFSPAANTLRATPAMPNPFTDKALVQIELTETSPVLLEVFGLDGRLLWSAEQTLPAGWQTLEIPSDALAHGSTGLYRVRAGSGVATGKVMRQ